MSHAPAPSPSPSPGALRLEFLDACRALAVLGMLFANMMNVFLRHVPSVLSHNAGDRLRALDFPAAIFQFLIGVSLVLFLEKRAARGLTRPGLQLTALRRFALLIALGIVLDCVGTLRSRPQWGVLQTLGLGGAVATFLADLPDASVAAVALVLLVVFSGPGNGVVHRNPGAALAFVPLTLAGLLVGRGLRAGRSRRGFVQRAATVAAASLVLAAAARGAGVPFNKILGTSSFVALAIAVSTVLLLATATLEQAGIQFPSCLLAVGSNALMAWVLQYVLVYYPAWLVFPSWRQLALVPGMVITLAALAILSGLTVVLGRRGVRIPI